MGLIGIRDLRLGLLLAFIGLLLSACQKNGGGSGDSGFRPQNPEKPYSATPIVYTGLTTAVTATATFSRYNDTGASGLNSIENALPIRFAEVHILNSAGNQIQQGETSANGTVTLSIPRTAGTYTLRVNSRADNANYKVSVLADPYDTQYYSLDQSFTLDGSQSTLTGVTLNASATNSGAVLGGAFNILDQVLVANEFLRSQAYSASCPMCVNDFTVAPKIQIFWQKGLSPATYYGSPEVPISFFLAESGGGYYRGIYMLGGVAGDVCTDTDHFDRSVILHEYGHFLENAFGTSASPGGSHDGNSLIDPRLAWSEGWADFFQAAVLGRRVYRDTSRNGGCANGASLSFPDFQMEEKNGTDVPVTNEGIFREISVARTLYDSMTGPNQDASRNMTYDTDSRAADLGFAPIWHAFKTLAGGSFKFQNMSQMNQLVTGFASTYGSPYNTDFASVLSNENQNSTPVNYGQTRSLQTASQAACAVTITQGDPVPDSTDSDGFITFSDPLRSNDYYRYDYDGSAAKQVLILKYRRSSGFATPYDLDVYIYNEKHVLLDGADIVASSKGSYPESGGPGLGGTYPGYESISFAGLPAGTYLINVKVYYQNAKGNTQYFFESPSGAQLCP